MTVQIIQGDCREVLATLPSESVHCVVTSPPYFGLRDYGVAGQIGLERSFHEYVAEMVAVFRAVRRVLRPNGTVWCNLGDSYASGGRKSRDPGQSKIHPAFAGESFADGLHPDDPPGIKPKDLLGIPWRVAFALQADGWWLRQDIIWSKPNPMPESVTDRCTKAHEYVFMLSKAERYYYDQEAIKEPASENTPWSKSSNAGAKDAATHRRGKTSSLGVAASDKQRGRGRRHAGFNDRWDEMKRADQCSGLRNKRSVWEVATQPFSEAHFATFPPALIESCILAGCPKGGTVLDPFGGAGTTGLVADRLQRDAILIELNHDYAEMARRRIHGDSPLFASVDAAPSPRIP